jgi:NAD/NADP transhydrogenase beta subunit
MRMRFSKVLAVAGVLACGLFFAIGTASASVVVGTISESGIATITATSLTFCNSSTEVGGQCPGTAGSTSWVVPSSATGSFCLTPSASCTGPTGVYDYETDSVSMTNLNTTNAPVGTLLPANGISFVTFNPTGGLPTPPIQLFLTELFAGTGTPGNCTTGMGLCTPPGFSVTLENTAGGDSSATISAMGVAISETGQLSQLSIVLTAQFTETEQALLAQFQTVGEVTSSYAGTFTATAVPEPSSIAMTFVGGALILVALSRRRKHSRL